VQQGFFSKQNACKYIMHMYTKNAQHKVPRPKEAESASLQRIRPKIHTKTNIRCAALGQQDASSMQARNTYGGQMLRGKSIKSIFSQKP